MVVNTIKLYTEDSVLRLITDENNWCEVKLQNGNNNYHLGAEDKNKIIESIKEALCKNNLKIIGELEGMPVAWFLSLAERHTSIYIGKEKNIRYIFFQNENGNTFAKLRLTPEIYEKWLVLLYKK